MCPGRRRTFGCKVRASHSVMVECRPAAKIRLSTHATASTDASSPPRTHRSKCQLFVAFQSSMSPLFLQCSVGTEHGVTNEHTSRATMRPLHAPYQCNCVRFLTWQVIKFEIGVAKSGVACTRDRAPMLWPHHSVVLACEWHRGCKECSKQCRAVARNPPGNGQPHGGLFWLLGCSCSAFNL